MAAAAPGPGAPGSLPIRRPIVYGSEASPVTPEEAITLPDPNHTHKWKVYLRGVDGEDISYFIDKVEIKLHESFASPIRTFRAPPYEVRETGWGEFDIIFVIWFIDPNEKPLTMEHRLALYPKPDQKLDHQKTVISEKYDEIEFWTPSVDLADALLAQPWESLPKPSPSKLFNKEGQEKEIALYTEKLKKIMQESESLKRSIAKAEDELQEVKATIE